MDMYNNNVGMTESVLTLRHQFPDRFTKYSTDKCLSSPLSLTYCSKLHTRSERWYSINYLLWSFLNGLGVMLITSVNVLENKLKHFLNLNNVLLSTIYNCVTQCSLSLLPPSGSHIMLYIVLWHFKFSQKYSCNISNIRHQMGFKNKYKNTCTWRALRGNFRVIF